MLLRSSSTPISQTLFSQSPTRDSIESPPPPTKTQQAQNLDHFSTNISFAHNLHHQRSLQLRSLSCNSSPISHSTSGYSEFNPKPSNLRCKPIRRAQSDGNLEELASNFLDIDEFYSSKTLPGSLGKQNKSMLRSEPSFCIYNSEDGSQENEKEDMGIGKGDSIKFTGSGEFSFGKISMGLIVEEDEEGKEERLSGLKNLAIEEGAEPVSPPMYLATGLGIDGNGIGGNNLNSTAFDESGDAEEYYKRMVSEDPSNSLFLRNYAQLLQSKGDLPGAEEYYFRATLADPKDGEILMQYAKLLWELHHDQDRALKYFESAAHAAPEDSHVLVAYASFLWEIDEDRGNDGCCAHSGHIQNSTFEAEERPAGQPLHLAAGLGVDVAGFSSSIDSVDYVAEGYGMGGDLEKYLKRMVEENPSNPVFLRNYAQFLCQSKGDLPGAEEYYFRATLADPKDGEILMQYAKLVWELHRDQDRALNYFESAARAAPEDSHFLAAYASFLWEIDEDHDHDGDFARSGHIQIDENESLIEIQNSTFEAEERPVSPPHLAGGLGVDVAGFSSSIGSVDYAAEGSGMDGNLEEYFKRMVEENPSSPLFLRNYAQFLCQSKGDLQGAEEFYSRAILADPGDGEVITQYAQLVWELHHDQDKASCYFERAVQAAPGDSHVLAAYARFLWETEDGEHSGHQDDIGLPVFQGAMTSANA